MSDRLTLGLAALLVIVVLVIVVVVRLAITGGDVACLFSDDPALCAAVKGLGR